MDYNLPQIGCCFLSFAESGYYKSKILHCLKILEYSDGRYIDDLLKAIKKSKLIK